MALNKRVTASLENSALGRLERGKQSECLQARATRRCVLGGRRVPWTGLGGEWIRVQLAERQPTACSLQHGRRATGDGLSVREQRLITVRGGRLAGGRAGGRRVRGDGDRPSRDREIDRWLDGLPACLPDGLIDRQPDRPTRRHSFPRGVGELVSRPASRPVSGRRLLTPAAT